MNSPKDGRIADLEMRLLWVQKNIKATLRVGYITEDLYRALEHIEKANVAPGHHLVVS